MFQYPIACVSPCQKEFSLLLHRYNQPRLTSDLALLFVESEYGQGFRWDDYVRPACLPKNGTDEIYGAGKEEGQCSAGLPGHRVGFLEKKFSGLA